MIERLAHFLDLHRKSGLLAAATIAVAAPVAFGQINSAQNGALPPAANAYAKLPGFEVASIKPNKSGSRVVSLQFTPDGFTAMNIPLKLLIREAYGVEEAQISGAPAWVSSQGYDIQAKVEGPDVDELRKLTIDQRRLMFQPLLADRFKLKIHRETKELLVYELVIAKNGPKLKEAKADDTYLNGSKGPGGRPTGAGSLWIQAGQLTGQAIPMAPLVRLLSDRLGRNVLDKTGLTGKYDFTLQWPPEQASAPIFDGAQPGQPGADNTPPPESSAPSIFTAIQEQLGLKLESQKAPVEIVVIDHVETPSEN